jgi:predicted DNA-binding transcriptional regulator AlpA
MVSLLRFRDLVERKITNNRPHLKRLQEQHGFPRGRMISPNIRTWTEDEIAAWYETRPVVEPGQWRGAARIKHEGKLAAAKADLKDKGRPAP